jgi:hypothetical protein
MFFSHVQQYDFDSRYWVRDAGDYLPVNAVKTRIPCTEHMQQIFCASAQRVFSDTMRKNHLSQNTLAPHST